MLIFAIDDEQAMLEQLHEAIAEAEPEAEILDFMRGSEALAAIAEQERKPDVVFSDIQLPGMDGLSLAVQIKNKVPAARIIFVTGYAQYAVEAYRNHINGYVMKPVDADLIRDELAHLPKPPRPEPEKLYVQCFGDFEVFWQGRPLLFERRQTKELFAYLIDKRGVSCTAEELSAVLWEEDSNTKAVKTRLRTLIHDLKKTLERVKLGQILIRRRGMVALDLQWIDCDYYRMLRGDMEAVNAFHGEYMQQYSWAELTKGNLIFLENDTDPH